MDRPIIFSGPMVKAILEDRKSMTRRVMKPQPPESTKEIRRGLLGLFVSFDSMDFENGWESYCPYGKPGDRLWVRETWKAYLKHCIHNTCGFRAYDTNPSPETSDIEYKATRDCTYDYSSWRSSIFMPRWASRITLEITDVRAERPQEITEEDASKEGIEHFAWNTSEEYREYTTIWRDCAEALRNRRKLEFTRLWNSLNGKKYPWDSNPWVWVISFRRLP